MRAGFRNSKNGAMTVNGNAELMDSNMNGMLVVKQDYYEKKSITEGQATQIAKDRWVYERQSLEAKASSNTTTSNLKALMARKEAKESDPSITEDLLNELFPFVVQTTQ